MAEELQVEKNVGPDFLVISHQWSGHDLTRVPFTLLNSLEIGDGTRSDTDAFCLLEPLAKGLVLLMALDFGFWHGYYSYYNTLFLSCCPIKFLILRDLMSLLCPFWGWVTLNTWWIRWERTKETFTCEMDMYTGKCSSISALIAAISVEEILSPSVLPQKSPKSPAVWGFHFTDDSLTARSWFTNVPTKLKLNIVH